jgi:hypothetical protein
MALVLRPATLSDRPALLRLFTQVFGGEAPEAEWRWKYDENPFRAVSIGAFEGDDAVGFFGGFATRYRGAEGAHPGMAGVDVMTSRAARRLGSTGVYKEMGIQFVERNRELGIPFYFGFPNERARVVGERLLGYQTVEAVGQWARPIGAAEAGAHTSSPTRSAPTAARLSPPKTSLLSRLRGRALRVVRRERFEKSHAALAEELHAAPGWRIDRSASTLNWRYTARPGFAYQIYELCGPRGASLAYAVVNVVGTGGLLVDAQVSERAAEHLPLLLAAIEGDVRGQGVEALGLRASRTSPLATLAPRLGFFEVAVDTWLELIPVDPAFDLAKVHGRFDYRFGEHEVF